MIFIIAIIVAALGLAWWKGRISFAQIPAAILMFVGATFAARGQILYGLGGIAIGAVLFYLRGKMAKSKVKPIGARERDRAISEARLLLGVSEHDDAAAIRARHRSLMTQNHPDTGGSQEQAQDLNAARDLLLAELETRG